MSYDLILRILEYSGLVTKGSDLTPAEVDENFLSLLECCRSRSSSTSQTGGIEDNSVDVEVSENGTNNVINVNAGTYLESFNVIGTGIGRLLINNVQVADLTIDVEGVDTITLAQNENVEFLFLDEEYFLLNSGINKNFDSMLEKTEFDDWFLGSQEDFEALQSTLGALEEYRTLYSLGLMYWTSTEVDKDTAKVIDMETGDTYDAPKNLVGTTYDELYTIPTTTIPELITLTENQDFVLLTKEWADYTDNAMNYVINCSAEIDYFGLSKEFNHFETGSVMDLDGLTIEGITFGVTENTPNSDYTITVNNGTRTHSIQLTNFEGNLGTIYTPKTRAIRSFESTDDHEIGDFAGGGYVYHKIDPDSSDPLAIKTYYVMAKEDTTSDYVYGSMDLLIGANGEAIGTGADNTELLAENDTTGAGVYLDELEYETDNDSNYIQPKDGKRFKIRDIDPSFTDFKEDIDEQYDDGHIPIWESVLGIWKRLRLTDLFSILKTYFDTLYASLGLEHTQNTDTKLDEGGANEVSAVELRTHVDDEEIHLSEEDRDNIEVCPLDEVTESDDGDYMRGTKCLTPTPYTDLYTLSNETGSLDLSLYDSLLVTDTWLSGAVARTINIEGNFIMLAFEDVLNLFDITSFDDLHGVVRGDYTFSWSEVNQELTINNGVVDMVLNFEIINYFNISFGTIYTSFNYKVSKGNYLKDYAKCATENLTLAVADWNYLAETIEIEDGGTGYAVDDVLTVAGGTGTAVTLKVTSVSGGVIDGIEILTLGEYSVIPANPVAVTGGTGNDDAEFNLTYTIEQKKTVAGLTATSIYSARVASDNTSFTTAKAYGVRDLSTDTDTITFTCVEEPDDDIDINLVISKY